MESSFAKDFYNGNGTVVTNIPPSLMTEDEKQNNNDLSPGHTVVATTNNMNPSMFTNELNQVTDKKDVEILNDAKKNIPEKRIGKTNDENNIIDLWSINQAAVNSPGHNNNEIKKKPVPSQSKSRRGRFSFFRLSPMNMSKSFTNRKLHLNVREQMKYSAGVVGLRNLGNTCFMNSSIQCLSNTIPLTDYFLGYDYKSEINKTNFLGTGGKLASIYAELMKDMWFRDKIGSKNSVSPRSFKYILETFAPQFKGHDQHDAQEFLAFLLDGIHEDLNRVTKKPYIEDKDCDGTNDKLDSMLSWKNYLLRNRSIIVDLFQGQVRNTLTCQHIQKGYGEKGCGHKSIKFEPFMYLSLPLSHGTKSLNDCLELYCRSEVLEGENTWYCSKCKAHVNSIKKIDLWMLPPILIVQLKRFKFHPGTTGGRLKRTKLHQNIQYPLKNWDLSSILKSSNHERPLYDLYSIINHVGDLGSGHYTAKALNRVDNHWYDFNDSYCRRSDGFGTNYNASSSAYCLFYNRITTNALGEKSSNFNANVPLIRRQTICRPELWPHMQYYDNGGNFRGFRRTIVHCNEEDSIINIVWKDDDDREKEKGIASTTE